MARLKPRPAGTPIAFRTLLAAAAVAGALIGVAAHGRVGQPAPTRGLLSIDAIVAIKHPSRPTFSPDGRRLAFIWDDGGVQNVWTIDATGGTPVAATRFTSGLIDNVFWSGSANLLTFARDGALWNLRLPDGAPERLWPDLDSISGAAPSPDGTRIAFERQGDVWVRDRTGGALVRLTQTPAVESAPVWSRDGQRIAFTSVDSVRHEDAPDYVGAKLRFVRFDRAWSDVGVVPATGGPVTWIARSPAAESLPAWLDATHVALQRVSEDLRTRSILVADATTGTGRVLDSDVDPKWWSVAGSSRPPLAPSPDGRWIAYLSDRTGWDQLYVVAAGGGAPIQLTSGSYEVRNLAWSPDSARIAFDFNQGPNPGVRHVGVAPVDRSGPVAALTSGRGTNIEPAWSPDGRRLVYQHTDMRNSADLFVIESDAARAPEPIRLTDSFPASIDRSALVAPEFVRYPAGDGQSVPAWLFVPAGLNRTQKHPAIVWVHGDGTNENYDGWHVQRNYAVYYSFHQYLAQHGYVVLAVDYRGSIGYGRDWRQGHYRDLGGKDYEDVAAGVGYLKSLGFVDTERIGLWGLSYGGFMTLQGLTVTPDLFRCGIDVAGVEDWADWYTDPDGPWIKARMGAPSANPDLYRRTAPIYRVDRIARPLLVLAGTADVNVPFLESVRLMDAVLKAGKDVDFMMYPGEFHYFQRAHVLRDAWTRAARFFDEHLAPSEAATARR